MPDIIGLDEALGGTEKQPAQSGETTIAGLDEVLGQPGEQQAAEAQAPAPEVAEAPSVTEPGPFGAPIVREGAAWSVEGTSHRRGVTTAERAAEITAWRARQATPVPDQDVAALKTLALMNPDMNLDWIAGHMDLLKPRLDQAELARTLAASPRLREWMAQDDVKAAAVREHAASLSWVEKWITGESGFWHQSGPCKLLGPIWLESLVYAAKDQLVNAEAGYLKSKVQRGEALTEEDKRALADVEDLASRQMPYDVRDEGVVSQAVTGVAGMAPYLALSTATEAGAGALVKTIGATGWVGKAASVGVPVLAQTLLNKQQFDGQLFLSLRSTTDANGNRLFSDKQAADWADGISTAQAIVTGPLSHVVSAGIASGGARKAVVDKLLEKATQATGKNVVKQFTKAQAAGLANIMAMNLTVKGGEAMAVASATGQPADYAGAAKAAVEETWNFLPTSVGLGLLGSRGAILEALGHEHMSWAESARRAVLEDAVRRNPTFKPVEPSSYAGEAEWNSGKIALGSDTAASLMAHLAQGERVFVDRAAFERVAQERNVDPAELAGRIMEDGGKAYREAVATKADDLSIPAGQFYGRLGGTEIFPALRDDIRLDQKGLTNRQSQKLREKWDAKAEEYRKAKVEEMPAEQRAVYEDYRAKSLGAGRAEAEADANARLVAATFRSWAERLSENKPTPVKADELYRDKVLVKLFGPDSKANEAAAEAPLESAPPRAELAQETGIPEAAQHLVGEKVTPESFFVDENSGVLNERAWKRAEAPPDKPLVAVVEPEGGKWVNDVAGHEQGDALLRTTAKALEDAGAGEVYKAGGGFRFYTNESHFAEVMQKARAAMGEQRFGLSGSTGKSIEEAAHGLTASAEQARAAGEMAPRGARPKGLPADVEPASLRFPEGRAAGNVPEHLQRQFAEMPEQERLVEHFTEEGTELLNEDGFRRSPEKKHQAHLDMDGLRALNDKLGKAAGNAALEALGRIMRKVGGAEFNAAHLHGDEYAAQHDDPAALKAWVDDVVRTAQDYRAVYELPDGSFAVVDGLGVSVGIGEGHERAEVDLQRVKAERAEAGERGVAANERRFRRFATREEAEAALGELGAAPDLQRGDRRPGGATEAGDDLRAGGQGVAGRGYGPEPAGEGAAAREVARGSLPFIRDESETPRELFHGTSFSFETFGESHLGKSTGAKGAERAFFLAGNRQDAQFYADNSYRLASQQYEDALLEHEYNGAPHPGPPPKKRIIAAHVVAENPLVLVDDSLGLLDNDTAALRYAAEHGHDAVIWPHGNANNSGYTVAVFSPEQIVAKGHGAGTGKRETAKGRAIVLRKEPGGAVVTLEQPGMYSGGSVAGWISPEGKHTQVELHSDLARSVTGINDSTEAISALLGAGWVRVVSLPDGMTTVESAGAPTPSQRSTLRSIHGGGEIIAEIVSGTNRSSARSYGWGDINRLWNSAGEAPAAAAAPAGPPKAELMLDRKAVLSKQPQAIQEALRSPEVRAAARAEYDKLFTGEMSESEREQGLDAWLPYQTGGDIYGFLEKHLGGAAKAAEWMKAHGIQGMLYRDGARKRATLYQESQTPGPRWYSQAERAATEAKQAKGTPASWWAILSKAPGVKKEELEFLGLKDWLDKQGKSVTREDVAKFIAANKLEVKERELGERDNSRDQEHEADLNEYRAAYRKLWEREPNEPELSQEERDVLGGRLNELDLKWGGDIEAAEQRGATGHREPTQYESYTLGGHKEGSYRELLFCAPGSEGYESAHFEEQGKGLLAHARISEHDVGGKPSLMIEEVQSDLHQAAREKGYQASVDKARLRELEREFTERGKAAGMEYPLAVAAELGRGGASSEGSDVPESLKPLAREIEGEVARIAEQERTNASKPPDAPLKTTWDEFVIKRLIRYAAEKGYERIAWTTGEQQAERYDLAKQVDEIRVTFEPGKESGHIEAVKDGSAVTAQDFASADQLGDVIGKEAAKRALEKRSDDKAVLEGEDLKVGGEGMRFAYDKRIPSVVDKLVKKFGGKVERGTLGPGTEDRAKAEEDARRDVPEEDFEGYVAQHARGPEVWSADLPPALVAKALAEGFPLFQRPAEGHERGYINFTMPGGKGPRRFDIHLLEGADRTTLAHETFHFLAEVFGDLASAPDAPEQMKGDFATLLKYMGHESHEARLAATEERIRLASVPERTDAENKRLIELTSREERASHAWEQYLAEGKAPDPSLVRVFARFRTWMISVYRKLSGPEEVYRRAFGRELNLNDDVRRVFDRMLSADAAANDAVDVEHRPMPDAVLKAMPQAERDEYLKTAASQRENATDTLVRRMAEATREENRAWAREEKAAITKQVEAELSAQPVYKAVDFLRDGLPGATTPEEAGPRLDRDAVAGTYSRQTAQQLERQHRGIYGADEARTGVTADELAELIGYKDGDELVQQLLATEHKGKAIRAETARRFKEKYGPALEDGGEKLAAAAMDAVHDERHATQVLRELHALARLVDPELARGSPEAGKEVIQATAERILLDKTVQEINPEAFLRMERSAADKAFQAANAGNVREAYAQKQTQALHLELYNQARTLSKQLASSEAYIKNTRRDAWRGFLGKASPVIRDAGDAILEAIGLAPEQWLEQGGVGQAALDSLVAFAHENALIEGYDLAQLRDLVTRPRGWQDLTVGEAQNVADAMHTLRAWAREAAKYDQETRVNYVDRMRETAAKLPELGKGSIDTRANTWWRKAIGILQSVDAALLSPESDFRTLDGGNSGVFHEALWDPYIKARNHEADLSRKYLKGIVEQWEKLPKETKKRLHERVDLSNRLPTPKEILEATNTTDNSVTRLRLIMIALNMGNAGNKQRLLDGYQWSEPQVMSVLNDPKIGLSKAEWEWVQGIWDSLEAFYPHLAALHERETGLKLGKVEATPIKTPFGEFRGGYFPAKYDPRPGTKQSQMRFMSDEKAVASVLAPSLFYPAVGHGHREARATRVEDVIDLDWSVVPAHVSQVIHDLAFREPVRQMARVVVDPEVEAIVANKLGGDRAKQLRPWLQAVATAQADSVPAHLRGLNSLFGWMKNRTVIAALGHSMSVPLGDLTAPLVAAFGKEVKARELAAVTAKLGVDWRAQRKFALESSPELQLRADRAMSHLRQQMGEMGKSAATSASMLRKVQDTAFYLMEQTDKMTATPIWLARYRQEIKAGKSHDDAVREADVAVQRSFSAENLAEQPALLRSRGAIGGLLMFYGYFSKIYQVNRWLIHETWMKWHDEDAGTGAKVMTTAEMAGRFLGVALATGALSELLSGRGREDDETWLDWLTRKTLMAPVQSVPFIGQPLETAYSKLVLGHTQQVSVRSAPGLAMMQSITERIGKLASEGQDDAVQKTFDALEIAGLLAGVPTRQARRTATYGIGLATGEKTPPTPAHAAAGLLLGEKDKKPTGNIVTAVEDAAKALGAR